MKKLFLTSGVILCMACPAFADEAHHDIKNDNIHLTNDDPATCQYPTLGKYTGPQTFYAKWAPHGYHVRYNNQVATIIQGTTTATQVAGTVVDDIDYNASYTIRNNINNTVFAKKGYTFTGWLSDHNLSNGNSTPVYDANNDNAYSPLTATTYSVAWLENSQNNPLTFLVSSATNDTVEMFAQWTPNKYNVVYNRGEHAKAGSTDLANYTDPKATAGMTFDAAYTALTFTSEEISAYMQAADGYTFCGWSTSSSQTCTDPTATNNWKWTGTTLANDTATDQQLATYDESGYNVYAIYAANHYTLTYNCGTPTVEGSNSVARFKGALSDATHAFDRIYNQNGYTLYTASDVCELDGYHIDTTTPWSCVITGTSTSVDVANVGATWLVANNVTCTANWTQNTIGLSWNVGADATAQNGGTYAPGANTNACTYDGSINVAAEPKKAGYDFQGWTTDPTVEGADTSGTPTQPAASVPAPANNG